MSKCRYPNCTDPGEPLLCDFHWHLWTSDTGLEPHMDDWCKRVHEEQNRPQRREIMSKCKYPNCNNFNGSDYGLCDFHFQLWQSIPGSEDVEDWCKRVYEEQNAGGEQVVPACAKFGCWEQPVSGSNFCIEHSPTWPKELLDSFSNSQATPMEFNRIQLEINKTQPMEKKSEKSILEEANEIVNGSRATDYGDAVESFKKISILATAMSGEVLSPLTCCLVLKAVKLARETNVHKRDNLVDECGYAELENRIRDWRDTSEDECIRHNGLLNEILWGAEEGM